MTNKHRALIVGPSWVGDMVMAQVLFACLKSNDPTCEIDVLAPEWSRPLTDRMPEVHRSHPMPIGHGQFDVRGRYALAKQFRGQYDEAYVLPNSWKSALIPFWAKIPKRVGWVGEMRYGLLNDIRPLNKARYPLMIERFAALAQARDIPLPKTLPPPRLVVAQDNVKAALAQYSLNTTKPILALCPGAEFGPSKRWPEQYYATVANEALAKGWQVWLFGSAKDSVVASTIQTLCHEQCCDLTGRTSLADAIDLMSLASYVVTNDSGLMHIASALSRPLTAVYGSTSPGFTPPLYQGAQIVQTRIDCSPCFKRTCPLGHHRCMRELTPDMVLKQLESVFLCAS